MTDINATFMALTQPLASSIQTITFTLQWLLGGVFGLYVIMAIYNFYTTRKQKKEIQLIKNQLVNINRTLIDIKFTLDENNNNNNNKSKKG